MTNFPQSSSNHPTNLELHFTQIWTINGSTIINISDQIVEGCVSQQQRNALNPITVARNDNVHDRNIYHIINHLSPHVNVPYFRQRTNVIPSPITMNSGLDYENMYNSGMNSILQNKATLFPQRSMIDDVVVIN